MKKEIRLLIASVLIFIILGNAYATVYQIESIDGSVITSESSPIENAIVELWDNFPGGSLITSTTTDEFGNFSLNHSQTEPFDIYVYFEGYYPNKVVDIDPSETYIQATLLSVPPISYSPEFNSYYCEHNTIDGYPLPVGSVVDAYDPNGIHCGTFFVNQVGHYGFMVVYQDDPFTPEDDGANPGEVISFFINGVEATTSCLDIWPSTPLQIVLVCLNTGECCTGSTGDVNCLGGDSPDISDITHLIDYLYISKNPLNCFEESDTNGDCEPEPSISDIVRLIDYLYLETHTSPVSCGHCGT
jgi:hypothetical protein